MRMLNAVYEWTGKDRVHWDQSSKTAFLLQIWIKHFYIYLEWRWEALLFWKASEAAWNQSKTFDVEVER